MDNLYNNQSQKARLFKGETASNYSSNKYFLTETESGADDISVALYQVGDNRHGKTFNSKMFKGFSFCLECGFLNEKPSTSKIPTIRIKKALNPSKTQGLITQNSL